MVTAEDQIYRLAHEGYSISEIVNLVSGNDGDIYNFIKQQRIGIKTVFKFRIVAPTGEIYYVRSLGHFIKVMFHYHPSVSCLTFLKARRYRVKEGIYRWKFIGNGSYIYHLTWISQLNEKALIITFMRRIAINGATSR